MAKNNVAKISNYNGLREEAGAATGDNLAQRSGSKPGGEPLSQSKQRLGRPRAGLGDKVAGRSYVVENVGVKSADSPAFVRLHPPTLTDDNVRRLH